MSDPRVRRIDARPATTEVAEYREVVGQADVPPPGRHDDPNERTGDQLNEWADELVHLCRFRNRPTILRNNLRFGRSLSAIRVADLDGDGLNEMLVVDNDRTIYTLRYQPASGDPWPAGPSWTVGAHRSRGKMLGITFSGFGVFRRQEAIITSVEEHTEGGVYYEVKLTSDGVQWDMSELMHRRPPGQHGGLIRLIGDSREAGRVPVVRGKDGRLWAEILDDRQVQAHTHGQSEASAAAGRRFPLLSGEISAMVLCQDELVVAYARGGLQCIALGSGQPTDSAQSAQRRGPFPPNSSGDEGRAPFIDGRSPPLLFPEWRFSCLAYASPAMMGTGRGQGLLLGGTTFGYVVAIDTKKSGVRWRMDAGFLFSCMALADVESSGRVDLLLGGLDGGLRIYELIDGEGVESRCLSHYQRLGSQAKTLLAARAAPGHPAYAAVQLFLLSRVLGGRGLASDAVVDLVRWFTPGEPGWNLLPERAQRDAVILLERYLLTHLPALAVGEHRSTVTGPMPIVSLEGEHEADPQIRALLTRTLLAELVDIYLAAPRLVRRQIDRISRKLIEQYGSHELRPHPSHPSEQGDAILPELQRLMNVRGLRAREYALTLRMEAEASLARTRVIPSLGGPPRQTPGQPSDVMMRVLRAIGLLEEARSDRLSMAFERLDLRHAVIVPPPLPAAGGEKAASERPSAQRNEQIAGMWIAGIGRNGHLRLEPVPIQKTLDGLNGTALPRGKTPPVHEVEVGGKLRFIEARSIWSAAASSPLGDSSAGPLPALLCGVDVPQGTRLLLFAVGPRGQLKRCDEMLIGAGAEPVGFDRHRPRPDDGQDPDPATEALSIGNTADGSADGSDGVPAEELAPEDTARRSPHGSASANPRGPSAAGSAQGPQSAEPGPAPPASPAPVDLPGLPPAEPAETLILRIPGSGEREMPKVVGIDAPGGRLRLREHLFPDDLLSATANDHASLQVTPSRILWRSGAGQLLAAPAAAPAPGEGRCCALSDDGALLAVGTSSGLLQIYAVVDGALLLRVQHLLPKGISALCFLPQELFEVPALSVGTEDEQMQIFAVDPLHEGHDLARLAVGGTPQRMICTRVPLPKGGARKDADAAAASGGHRLTLTLQGGVVAAWDAPAQGPGPDGDGDGDGDSEGIARLMDLATRAAGSRRAALSAALLAPGPHARAVAMREILRDARRAGRQELLRLARSLLSNESPHGDQAGPDWPLPRPERSHIVLSPLCEALVPLALGGADAGPRGPHDPPGLDAVASLHDPHDTRLCRDLLHRIITQSDHALAIRAHLLHVIEQHVRPEQVLDLLTWLPHLVLHDPRSAVWTFSIDSVGALFLQHLKRLDRAGLFDQAEPEFFRNVALVLEAVLPSQPSRLLLTQVALLLRSALDWDRATWAGDLGRARLYLPHAVIESLCQPALIPDAEARAFLLGVSRRWGPRLPMIGGEDGEAGATLPGMSAVDEYDVDWWLEVAVESGFDELYYERLADELARFTRPAAAGETEPDAWALGDTVQAVLRLFKVGNLTELVASLTPASAERSLGAIGRSRGQAEGNPFYRYRDQAWAFLDERAYEDERLDLSLSLQQLDRKSTKVRLARSLHEIADRLEERRVRLRTQVLACLLPAGDLLPPLSQIPATVASGAATRLLDGAPGAVPGAPAATTLASGYSGRLLAVRPTATVIALLATWWQVLSEEEQRLRSEADFDVRLAADLGLSDGRRTLRYAVLLAPDTNRPAHNVQLTVRSIEPPELRVSPSEPAPMDLEPGREVGLTLDCPAALAADGLRYRIEIEIAHDDGKRTERVIEGQFSRDPRPMARSLFDGFAENLPTVFALQVKRLQALLDPPQAAVALITAFPAHAYELLGDAVGLEWPDRPVDTFGNWRMINLAARHVPHGQQPLGGPQGPGSHGGHGGHAHGPAALRDVLQQIGARLGAALGIDGAERLDTVDSLVRAVREASERPGHAPPPRGLLILGLPELYEKARLEDADQRQLLSLGARLSMAYRGRALVLLTPAAAALSLHYLSNWLPGEPTFLAGLSVSPGGLGLSEGEEAPYRGLEFLDLDHVADPLSQSRLDERSRGDLERALALLLGEKKESSGAFTAQDLHDAIGTEALTTSPALHGAIHALIDATGTDLRLIAECLPLVEQALRERTRTPLGISAFEGRVSNYLTPVWASLPLPHRLYLAALCSDAVELDLADLKPGMVVDAPVHSISGKDRRTTSKVVVAAGVRLDERTVEDLNKVMWLKKVRVRGSLQDSRTVLWTYLRQPRPRHEMVGHSQGQGQNQNQGRHAAERWLEPAAADLRRLGLIRVTRLSGERHFHVFTSPAVREWLRNQLGLLEGEAGLTATIDGRNLVRQLPLWDAAAVDRILGGNSLLLRGVLGWSRNAVSTAPARWHDFLELSRACRKWIDGQDEPRFIEAIARYFRLDPVEGTAQEGRGGASTGAFGSVSTGASGGAFGGAATGASTSASGGHVPMRSVQIRFRDQRQLPWLKRVVLYLPAQQPDRHALDQVQHDLRARMQHGGGMGGSGPHLQQRPDAGYAGAEGGLSDTSLSAIVVVPELSAEVVSWGRNLFHVATIDVADLQYAALHDSPVEELIRRLAAAASYAALSPFRSKMGLANQELIEEMFYGRRLLLEEIRGQRQENFIIVGPRKIGKTSLLQRVRLELEQQGYRVIPRGMDYTTAPSSRELLRAMISALLDDLEPGKGAAGGHDGRSHFALGEPLPPLRSVVDTWSQRFPDRSVAIVLDEIDTVLRIERRAYLLGEWREAGTIGEALAGLLPPGSGPPSDQTQEALHQTLLGAGFTRDVVSAILEGLLREPNQRHQSPLLEELRSASALALRGGAVCRVILAGHAELVEARSDLFGPLLNFAKLRFLGPLDETAAERMVREPFARLGLRFETAAAAQQLLQQTFRVPAWLQHCGALIIQSIDERLRSSRREEQKITERDVLLSLEKVHAEERAALQSENGLYMLGPECSFVLLNLVDEPWFTVDGAVEFLRVWYELLEPQQRAEIARQERDYVEAFSPEVVRRIVRDLTNTFFLTSDEAAGQGQGMLNPSGLTPALGALILSGRLDRGGGEPQRDRLRRAYRVNAPMVRTVFRDELTVAKRIELARRGMRLWEAQSGVWARTSARQGR